jgi:hypothetical protein
MAGLTSSGITIKSVDEILTDMESEQLANIAADLNVEADSVLGQLNGIYAAALAELWELLEQVYQAAYPDTASGQSLSYIDRSHSAACDQVHDIGSPRRHREHQCSGGHASLPGPKRRRTRRPG